MSQCDTSLKISAMQFCISVHIVHHDRTINFDLMNYIIWLSNKMDIYWEKKQDSSMLLLIVGQ